MANSYNYDDTQLTARLEQGLFDMGAGLVGYAALSRHIDSPALAHCAQLLRLSSRGRPGGLGAVSLLVPLKLAAVRRSPPSMVSLRTSIGTPGGTPGDAAAGGFHPVIDNGPTPDYARAFGEAGELLEELAGMTVQFLKRRGYAAQAQAGRDRGNPAGLTPELADEKVAALAGLGWIGKNTLLTTRRHGSAIRLATVFTDAPLPYGSPVTFSSCGSCSACVENCPAKALADVPWRDGTQRDEQMDLKACQKQALSLSKKNLGKSVLLCGRCMAVCPFVTRDLLR